METVNEKLKKRLELAERVAERFDGEVGSDEIFDMAERIGSEDMDDVAGMIVYAKARLLERMGMVPSFRKAFPNRCVKRQQPRGSIYETDKPMGEPLDKSTISVKAKRLEASKRYQAVMALIQAPLHIAYAVDRMAILEKAFEISMSEEVSPRDRHQYMKLFLEETRKPADVKGMELNVNLTQNNVSIRAVEEKLDSLASQFHKFGADAQQVIEAISYNNDGTTQHEVAGSDNDNEKDE